MLDAQPISLLGHYSPTSQRCIVGSHAASRMVVLVAGRRKGWMLFVVAGRLRDPSATRAAQHPTT